MLLTNLLLVETADILYDEKEGGISKQGAGSLSSSFDLFNELEENEASSASLSSIALIVGCYSMIHLR